MTKYTGTIDLSINFECDQNTLLFIRKYFHINTIGIPNDKIKNLNRDFTIMKVKNSDNQNFNEYRDYLYLFYENLDNKFDQKRSGYDILVIGKPSNYKPILQKLDGRNIGFEFLVSNLKYLNSSEVGKWFSNVKYFYQLCKKYKHQLILSSGAKSIYELISPRIIDSILKKMDISSAEYWSSLRIWLENKNRGITHDPD
ncbi:MAG: hypothetical protein M3Y25_03680 [Thermoproteota archaeon]|nr:hypothetical protein [Thermoproteota archaeon]